MCVRILTMNTPFHQSTHFPIYVHLPKNTCRQHSTRFVTSWQVLLNIMSFIFHVLGSKLYSGWVSMSFISCTFKCENILKTFRNTSFFLKHVSKLKLAHCPKLSCWNFISPSAINFMYGVLIGLCYVTF